MVGSMIGRHVFAANVAEATSIDAKCISVATPVVPARWAPARQWIRTLLPSRVKVSISLKTGSNQERIAASLVVSIEISHSQIGK